MNITIGRYEGEVIEHVTGQHDWDGWIEPEDKSWILFFARDGRPAFWPSRDKAGGVIGEPSTR